jgi:hypothetical protein
MVGGPRTDVNVSRQRAEEFDVLDVDAGARIL